jgi:molecular chaperone HtpG
MPPPPRAEKSGSLQVDDLVKELVHQFSETLAFYRELIQNSIDANANRIDVVLTYDAVALRAVISVEDDGDGMNERIIDDYLLVLFKSSKDDDLTKIGKFGIGFVSVFGPKPELVRVSTARDGESWRLDFPSYKRWDKYKMPDPRDGTKIELFKAMTRDDYDRLVIESLKIIRYWCRHSETNIVFHDKTAGAPLSINEPFDLPDGASKRYKEEGTEIVMGATNAPAAFYGFYNRGLTLKEGLENFVPAVEFKVKSRFLEHTLTRDNVVRDENFGKVLAIVRKIADKELPNLILAELAALAAEISAAAARGDQASCDRLAPLWNRRTPYVLRLFARFWTFGRGWTKALILPCVSGQAVCVADMRRATRKNDGTLYVDKTRTGVSDELERRGSPVLWDGPWIDLLGAELLNAFRKHTATQAFILPRALAPAGMEPGLSALLRRVNALDAAATTRYSEVCAADFAYPGSPISELPFVVQDEAGQLSIADERPVHSFFSLGRKRRAAVINAAHPFIRRLGFLHATRPGFAAYLLLKTLHLHDGEVPSDSRAEFSALAQKTERRLLDAALKLDAAGKNA